MAEIKLNRPNWLGSEVGLVLKTAQLATTFNTSVVTENGRKIAKSGAIVVNSNLGTCLLYHDADITDEAQIVSLMVRGSYIDANLPATASASTAAMIAQGLYAVDIGEATRPDFGDNTLATLGTVTVTVLTTSGVVTWTSEPNAVRYGIYDVNKKLITTTEATGHTFTTEATYNVAALADNVYYSNGDYVSFTVTSVAA